MFRSMRMKHLTLGDGRELRDTNPMLAATHSMSIASIPRRALQEHAVARGFTTARRRQNPAFPTARAGGGRGKFGGPGRHASGAICERSADRGAPPEFARDDVAISDRSDRRPPDIRPGDGRKSKESRARGTSNGSRSSRARTDRSPRRKSTLCLFSSARARKAHGCLPMYWLDSPRICALAWPDEMAAEAYARTWKEKREPLLLETSVPGVLPQAICGPATP